MLAVRESGAGVHRGFVGSARSFGPFEPFLVEIRPASEPHFERSSNRIVILRSYHVVRVGSAAFGKALAAFEVQSARGGIGSYSSL